MAEDIEREVIQAEAILVYPQEINDSNIDKNCSDNIVRCYPKHDENQKPDEISPFLSCTIHTAVTIFCLAIYIIPIRFSEEPVLDELHIFDTRGGENPNLLHNADVMGESDIRDLFGNDFWGKDIFQMDSHKSWRPLTVLSFRYLNSLNDSKLGIFHGLEDALSMSTMFTHRLISIIIHAFLADVVAIAGVTLFPPQKSPNHRMLQFTLTKLFFALHPTHNEAVVNAANRGHLMALLAAVYSSFGFYTDISVVHLATVVGLLSSETFVFQLPAIIVTIALVWYRKNNNFEDIPNKGRNKYILKSAIHEFIPQTLLPIALTFLYLFLRYYYDTLSIVKGLIIRAENPFYAFEGFKRFINYSYAFAVHICKGIGFDPIGSSHEYGFNCVPALESIYDERLLLTFSVYLFLLLGFKVAYQQMKRDNECELMIQYVFFISWMATLFPITGIVRVGTFIADRMVIPFTFSVTILAGKISSDWLFSSYINSLKTKMSLLNGSFRRTGFQFFFIFFLMSAKTYDRSWDWMRSVTLFESSLKVCPNYAKANLQLAKVYSGTIPGMENLEKSMEYTRKAEAIDPDYCQVHYQYTLLYYHMNKFPEFEERLVKAMQCPFTALNAHNLWVQYWRVVTDPHLVSAPEATKRLNRYKQIINDALEKNEETTVVESTSSQRPDSEFEL